MRAVIIKEFGKPLVDADIPKPSPGPGQVLVKLNATGICHTDLHQWRGDWPDIKRIMEENKIRILGHEGVGVIEEVGPGVITLGPGDRVGVPWMNYWDGKCELCLSGYPHWCLNAKYTSVHVNGTYAEYALIHEVAAPLIPREIPDIEAAPLMCAGVTAYGAVRRLITEARIPTQKLIAIIGAAGGLGHYAVQIAKAFGYKVVGIDVGPERIKFVEELGADYALDAPEAEQFIKNRLGGVYAAIVLTPNIDGYKLAVKILRPTGALIAVGIPAEREGLMPLTPNDIVSMGIKIIPSSVGVTHEFDHLFQLVIEKKIKTHVAKVISLSADEINKTYEELEKGKYIGRAVIKIR